MATGRYNAPDIPSIPGLAAWGERWPDQVFHSRNYRTPEVWANKVSYSILVFHDLSSRKTVSSLSRPSSSSASPSPRPKYRGTSPHSSRLSSSPLGRSQPTTTRTLSPSSSASISSAVSRQRPKSSQRSKGSSSPPAPTFARVASSSRTAQS